MLDSEQNAQVFVVSRSFSHLVLQHWHYLFTCKVVAEDVCFSGQKPICWYFYWCQVALELLIITHAKPLLLSHSPLCSAPYWRVCIFYHMCCVFTDCCSKLALILFCFTGALQTCRNLYLQFYILSVPLQMSYYSTAVSCPTIAATCSLYVEVDWCSVAHNAIHICSKNFFNLLWPSVVNLRQTVRELLCQARAHKMECTCFRQ